MNLSKASDSIGLRIANILPCLSIPWVRHRISSDATQNRLHKYRESLYAAVFMVSDHSIAETIFFVVCVEAAHHETRHFVVTLNTIDERH